MNYIKKNKHIVAIILPLLGGWLINILLGWMINNNLTMLSIFMKLTWIFCFLFIIFWVWVGKLYAELPYSKIISFIVGNLLWLISLAVFLWQFVFLDGDDRSMFWAVFSQYYIVFINPIAGWIAMQSKVDVIDGSQLMIVSYILMLALFSIGLL